MLPDEAEEPVEPGTGLGPGEESDDLGSLAILVGDLGDPGLIAQRLDRPAGQAAHLGLVAPPLRVGEAGAEGLQAIVGVAP